MKDLLLNAATSKVLVALPSCSVVLGQFLSKTHLLDRLILLLQRKFPNGDNLLGPVQAAGHCALPCFSEDTCVPVIRPEELRLQCALGVVKT